MTTAYKLFKYIQIPRTDYVNCIFPKISRDHFLFGQLWLHVHVIHLQRFYIVNSGFFLLLDIEDHGLNVYSLFLAITLFPIPKYMQISLAVHRLMNVSLQASTHMEPPF